MSVVIGICGKNFCSLIADSRLVENCNGTAVRIVNDDTQKIFQINDCVLYGMTGFFGGNETILTPFDEYRDKSILTLPMAYKAVMRYSEKLTMREDLLVGITRNYFVGGRDNKGQFCLYEIHLDFTNKKVECNERRPSKNQFGVCISVPPGLESRNKEFLDMVSTCVTSHTTHGNMLKGISNIIKEIADLNMTVGKNVRTVTVS